VKRRIGVAPALVVLALVPLAFVLMASQLAARAERPSAYLFAWTNSPETAYMATIDLSPESPRRGTVVASFPVGIRGGRAHHTEHELGETSTLLANLFEAGRTFLFDVRDPLHFVDAQGKPGIRMEGGVPHGVVFSRP